MMDNHNYTVASLGLVHNSGKRNGSIACYLEIWHLDIEDFLKLKLNTGIDEERARDLFYAVWISDLFMNRVEADADWSLMCPDKCPNLYTTYGKEFEELYEKYEREGRANKVVKARVIWEAILTAQMETGTPYIGYKDAVNIKNNQKNLGTIQCSNLCHEICEYTSREEIAVCNLASVALPKYIDYNKEICKDTGKEINKPFFNFEKMREIVKQIVKNLNKIIDYNYYPVKEAEYSNRRNRPEGIGNSGLSNIFAMMKIAFDSDEARALNREIFENMYYAALEASMEVARKRKKYVQEYKRIIKLGSTATGELTEEDKKRLEELKTTYFIIDEELKLPNQYAGAYSTFVGSPLSEGKFQFDLWNVEPSEKMKPEWEALRSDIQKHGVRNSLLIALMPTASTSQILGWNECIEPFTNNIYTRKTLAGTFIVINKDLISDLLELGIWNQVIKDKIILADGSVQEIAEIPQNIRDRYKTVWEMKQKVLIDMAADRAPFVCQTQSMNLFVKNPTYKTLSAMHFYSWKKGLKTGIYYLRSQAKTSAQKFSVDLEKVGTNGSNNTVVSNNKEIKKEEPKKEKEEPECIMCSS
jgi:ribonucleoside-diphosphate reductase alpha chain